MGKNIIVCCDGTSNQFGEHNTNVVRLVQCLDRTPGLQRLYYDPGVGTLPEPSATSYFKKKVSLLMQQAFGVGLSTNVQEAYTYLMDFWEPGDSVYLFGFSRGAYTVRVLAGLLHHLGLLPRGNYNLVPYVWQIYKSMRYGALTKQARREKYEQVCSAFRRTFSRETQVVGSADSAQPKAKSERRFSIKFMGIWDCVSSVGWVYNPTYFRGTVHNPSVEIVRHAISIDERRAFFRQNLMEKPDGSDQDLKQYWFPGVHADVGGGYPTNEGDLWKEPFKWIVSEAQRFHLHIRPANFSAILNSDVSNLPFSEQIHNSLTWKWYPAEFIPKRIGGSGLKLRWNLFSCRKLESGSFVHRSAFKKEYGPGNLSAEFLTRELEEDADGAVYII